MVCLAVAVDDAGLRQEMVVELGRLGFAVTGLADRQLLREHLTDEGCDVVILDWGRRHDDDETLAYLRETYLGGVVLLCGDNVETRVRGFRAGADLHLPWPPDIRELAAATENLARRICVLRAAAASPAGAEDGAPSWLLDTVKWELTIPDGRKLPLTGGEFRFLGCLMAVPGRPVPRAEIIRALGYLEDGYEPRSLDAVVRRLRRKAERVLGIELPIRAAHAHGYVFIAAARGGLG